METYVTILYTNWRGETAERVVVPDRIYFGATSFHKTPQWLMTAHDVEKDARREFALCDIQAWHPVELGSHAESREISPLRQPLAPVPALPIPPPKPEPPLSRLLREGAYFSCVRCHSSATRRYWLFGRLRCDNPRCPTHNG